MESPIVESALALLAAGASPDDTITATWPDGPNFIPIPLASFRDRPPPYSYVVSTYNRR